MLDVQQLRALLTAFDQEEQVYQKALAQVAPFSVAPRDPTRLLYVSLRTLIRLLLDDIETTEHT